MLLRSSLSLVFIFLVLQSRIVQSSHKHHHHHHHHHPRHINNGRITLNSPISPPPDPNSLSIPSPSPSQHPNSLSIPSPSPSPSQHINSPISPPPDPNSLSIPSPSPSPSPSQHPNSPLVPALFVFGDSSVDCGTNNFLGTFARADLVPYGRDFDTHTPTGRFCNGRIVVDYLALQLGLPFVPAFLGQDGSVEDMIQGVNFASASAGIIFSSGSELGQHISLTQQIQQAMDTFQQFILTLGEEQANAIISKSIFYLSIGSNDFIHFYLRNVSGVQALYFPWGFNHLLVSIVKQELKNLYNANVRRIVVMGLAPLGCAPHYLWQYNSKNGECVEEINDLVMEFNFAMRFMVNQLAHELSDADITFCGAFEASMDMTNNRERYGFEVTTEACCGLGPYKGWMMCLAPEMACDDASTHLWWDQFHPTDAVNEILAGNIWSDQHMKMCFPTNLQDMT